MANLFSFFLLCTLIISLSKSQQCQTEDTTLNQKCGIPIGSIFAWYDGDSFDSNNNIWLDKSGKCKNVVSNNILGTVQINNNLNNNKYISGTTATKITFPSDVLPPTYTLINVAKYNGATKGRIIQATNYNFLSGFWMARSGVAYHSVWITDTNDKYASNWVISTDQRSLYRSNGIDVTTGNAANSDQFHLSINTGVYPAEVSDFAMSDIIVFDYQLTNDKYRCIEDYLAKKYLIYETCQSVQAPFLSTCGLSSSDLVALYDGSSYDSTKNIWYDLSGNCHENINYDGLDISGTITKQDNINGVDMNGKPYITGVPSTRILFHSDLLPKDYTLFHVAKYNGATKGRIFLSPTQNWVSGFYGAQSGIAYRSDTALWLTDVYDRHGSNWVISTDQPSMYRSNFIDRTYYTITNVPRVRLGINRGVWEHESSDFAVAEVMIFNKVLNKDQYQCIENYLGNKYNLFDNCPAKNLAFLNQCPSINEVDIQALYDGESYDSSLNKWFDKSGQCQRNINRYGNEIIGSIINTNTLNGKKIIQGTTATSIRFPEDLLPNNDYTLIHVAKYNGATKRRILSDRLINWLSGFWNARSGVAFHNHWITDYNDHFGSNWLISTDQLSLYRGNGIDYTVANGVSTGKRITINKGVYGETSDFAIVELIAFNRKLSASEYKCIECYLSNKYALNLESCKSLNPTNNPTVNTNNPTPQPTLVPTNEPCQEILKRNIQFILDDSGSVGIDNWNNYVVQFTKNLIERDINPESIIDIFSFDNIMTNIWGFTQQTQYPRNDIINALTTANYNGGATYTLEAIQEGINRFKNANNVNSNEPNVIFLVTDGVPTAGHSPCNDFTGSPSLREQLDEYNIKLVVIGININGGYSDTELQCLGNAEDRYLITAFSEYDFSVIEKNIRKYVCPGNQIQNNNVVYDNSNNNNLMLNFSNNQWYILTFVGVIMLFVGYDLIKKYYLNRKEEKQFLQTSFDDSESEVIVS